MIKLPNTDLMISKVCLGTDIAGTSKNEAEFFEILDAFTEGGGNFVDTANIYGRWMPHGLNCGEMLIGKWMKTRSKELIVASKCGHYDLATHKKRINKADLAYDMDTSLSALGRDFVDLYYLHRDDPDLPIGEILEMMNEFVKAGKIRYIGGSNFSPERIKEGNEYAKVHGIAGFSAVSNQHSYATVNRGHNTNTDPTLWIYSDADRDIHEELNMPLIPFQSTARGYFAKKAAGRPVSGSLGAAYDNPENDQKLAELIELSKETGKSVQALSIIKLIESEKFPVVPVVGVSRKEHLNDIFEAMK